MINTEIYKLYRFAYEEAPFAVFVIDNQYTVIWNNKIVDEQFSVLKIPGGLFSVLACDNEYELSDLFLSKGRKPAVLPTRSLMGDVGFFCIPVFKEDKFLGACFQQFGQSSLAKKDIENTVLSKNEKGIARLSVWENELLAQNFNLIRELATSLQVSADPRLKHMTDMLYQNNMKNLRFIRNFILFSKYNSGVKDFTPIRMDFTRFAKQLTENLKTFFEKSRITLTVTYPSRPVCIYGDEDKLMHAILCLISNSCKSIRGEGRINLVFEQKGNDRVVISVSDTGEGIPPDVQEQIFQPWVRGREHMRDMGMGLTLVEYIAKEHGGKVMFETGAGGTTFLISIPIDQSGEPPLNSYSDYFSGRFSDVNIELCDAL